MFDLYWIFLLGQSEDRLSRSPNVDEGCILCRDVYVTPWGSYKLVGKTGSDVRHLGLKSIAGEYDFEEHIIGKGTLHIASAIAGDVDEYFLSGKS
jgi:hypothetical protein